MHCRPSQRRPKMFRKRSTVSSSSSAASSFPPHAANTNGTAGGDSASPALIQRLIILHDGLMQQPPSRSQQRRSPQLSEDASLEEHGEFILYYYDHSLHFSQGRHGHEAPTTTSTFRRKDSTESVSSVHSVRGEKPPADYATEEAVRFAGICRALRSLPLALQQENESEENNHNGVASEEELSETNVVHLKDSTLVFVPLELRGDIFAIAQIPRANKPQMAFSKSGHSQNQRASMGFGADPSAMQGAMRHIHATFSLIFGGGIHRRLLRTKNVESSKDWVFEVIVDNEKEDERRPSFGRGIVDSEKEDERSSLRNSLSVQHDSVWEVTEMKEDSVWEVTDDEHVEPVETEYTPKKVSRRKSRTLKSLSRSFSMGSSFNSSADTVDDNQMKKHHLEDSHFVDYRYGGMEELFSLRREHRKLSNELTQGRPTVRFGGLERESRWASSATAEDLFNDIANDVGHNDCDRRIENLLKLLPITELREDLVKFYDEWLRRMQGVCEIIQGGVGRCVVEMVPSPMIRGGIVGSARDPVRGQHPPLSPTAFVCLAAGEFMKSLMHEEVPKLKGFQGRLFGMSLFYQNRLVLSEVFPSHGNKHGHVAMSFPPEIPYMIAEYFRSSQKRQMKTETAADHVTVQQNVAQDANERTLTRWMSGLSIGAAMNDSMADNGKPSSSFDAADSDTSPGYMARPSSLSDLAGPVESLFVHSLNKHVWLPRIHLPCTSSFEDIDYGNETETHAAFFESQELSFVLIFELPCPKGENGALAQMAEELKPKSRKTDKGSSKLISNATQAFTGMLTFLADQLTEFCDTHSSHEVDPASNDMAPTEEINSSSVFPGEPGMDIICIDRDENSFVLLSQHDLSSNEFKRIVPKNDGATSTPKFGLFGMGSKPKETSDQKIPCHPLQYTNMLDCRHKLAAYLPLDVMLAFDDMFNEFGCLSCRRNVLTFTAGETGTHVNNDKCTKKSMELCTFLPQGWVYGRAFGNVELYILLDTSKFVTINDVQKAVTRVRERIFNDKIR